VIATESTARKDDFAPLRAFVEEIIDSADGGEVAFANLNYDALLMAAICRDYNHDLLRLGRRAVPKCLPLHHGRRLGTGASTPNAREAAVPSTHPVAPPRVAGVAA
jgi:hypothetical protein